MRYVHLFNIYVASNILFISILTMANTCCNVKCVLRFPNVILAQPFCFKSNLIMSGRDLSINYKISAKTRPPTFNRLPKTRHAVYSFISWKASEGVGNFWVLYNTAMRRIDVFLYKMVVRTLSLKVRPHITSLSNRKRRKNVWRYPRDTGEYENTWREFRFLCSGRVSGQRYWKTFLILKI